MGKAISEDWPQAKQKQAAVREQPPAATVLWPSAATSGGAAYSIPNSSENEPVSADGHPAAR